MADERCVCWPMRLNLSSGSERCYVSDETSFYIIEWFSCAHFSCNAFRIFYYIKVLNENEKMKWKKKQIFSSNAKMFRFLYFEKFTISFRIALIVIFFVYKFIDKGRNHFADQIIDTFITAGHIERCFLIDIRRGDRLFNAHRHSRFIDRL